MLSKTRKRFSYANVMSTVGVFLVLGGGAAVAAGIDKDSVRSKAVKDNALRSKDLKDGSAVGGVDVVDNGIKGADVDESSLEIPQQALPSSLPPSGPAGGSLSGEFPNPTLAPNSVGGGEIQDGSLSAADLSKVTGSFSLNPANIPAGDCTVESPNVPGVELDDILIVTPPFNHMDADDEFSITVGEGTFGSPVAIKFCNTGAVDENPNGGTYFYMAVRP